MAGGTRKCPRVFADTVVSQMPKGEKGPSRENDMHERGKGGYEGTCIRRASGVMRLMMRLEDTEGQVHGARSWILS